MAIPHFTAEGFFLAWYLLGRELPDSPDPKLVYPYAVNGAFCIELYLKALSLCTKGGYLTDHKLDELFKALSLEEQQQCNTYFLEEIRTEPCASQWRELESAMKARGTTLPSDLQRIFREIGDSFVKMRYPFELGFSSLYGCRQIRDALQRRLFELHPALKPKELKP